jgi:DNA-binding transcriptional MerR regulator
VRFYERRGLLPAPARATAAQRHYEAQALERMRFIREAKSIGFTLAEIGELLSLPGGARGACEALAKRGERKIEEIAARIRLLRHMKRTLETMLADCAARPADTPCERAEALRRAARS